MKGYFSQLARHTGLRFTNAAHPTAPALGTQHPSPSPLHVEEVTFVPPAATVSSVPTSTEPPSITPAPENATTSSTIEMPPATQTVQATQTQTGILTSSSEAFPATVHASSLPTDTSEERSGPPVDHQASPIEYENVRPLATEHQSPFPERNAERDPISAKPAENEVQQTEASAQPINDLNLSDPVEREVFVRQYLREVRAWVAAPPTPIADVAEESLTQETQLTTVWQPESVATVTVDREAPTAKQPTQRGHIDVHETSLSIGSISVVIEDPKPAATTIAPTSPAPSASRPQPQPEPTNLSRYYLQRW